MTMERTWPIVCFIHVPKTAGQTVNEHLVATRRSGKAHVEEWIENPKITEKNVLEVDWISGHVPLPKMRSALQAVTDRELLFFTAVRNPLEQVCSSFNWVIEIYHRGERFYDSHSVKTKKLSEEFRAADLSNVDEILKLISDYEDQFSNIQAKYVLGEEASSAEEINYSEIEQKISLYSGIANEAAIGKLVERMTGKPYGIVRDANISNYHFDKRNFFSKPIVEVLEKMNKIDLCLYKFIKERIKV